MKELFDLAGTVKKLDLLGAVVSVCLAAGVSYGLAISRVAKNEEDIRELKSARPLEFDRIGRIERNVVRLAEKFGVVVEDPK